MSFSENAHFVSANAHRIPAGCSGPPTATLTPLTGNCACHDGSPGKLEILAQVVHDYRFAPSQSQGAERSQVDDGLAEKLGDADLRAQQQSLSIRASLKETNTGKLECLANMADSFCYQCRNGRPGQHSLSKMGERQQLLSARFELFFRLLPLCNIGPESHNFLGLAIGIPQELASSCIQR